MTFNPLGFGRRGVLLGCIGVGIAACSSDLAPLPDSKPETYRLGPGDLLRVLTFGEEQLTGEFRVDDQGKIAVPLIGNVTAAGRTPGELEGEISRALLRGDYLKNPHVSVEVIAYRPIFVLGEVSKPGQYPYQPGMTFLTAVAVAGGFTYRGVQDYGEVVRTSKGVAESGRVTPNSFLAPGDVVRVRERYF